MYVWWWSISDQVNKYIVLLFLKIVLVSKLYSDVRNMLVLYFQSEPPTKKKKVDGASDMGKLVQVVYNHLEKPV